MGLHPIISGLAKVAGPGIVGGMICKWLENSSAEDVYNMAVSYKTQNMNAWDIIPHDWRTKLKNYNSTTNILDQLDLEWLVAELIKCQRNDLASLTENSEEVAEFAEAILRDLKEGAKSGKV